MDRIRELGHLALATRLRRLGERLGADVSRFYADQRVPFRSRWFPVFIALRLDGDRAVSELADSLGLTHTGVAQIARQLERAGLVASSSDPEDGRRRILGLTDEGRAVALRLEPVWEAVGETTRAVATTELGDLLAGLEAVESRLDRRSLYDRLSERRSPGVEIVGYRPALAPAFRELNLAAMAENGFSPEAHDRALLDDPAGELLALGGSLFFAVEGEAAVGTCGLARHPGEVFEITKMAVHPDHRGQGIGRLLTRAAVRRAWTDGARRVLLLTSPRLEAAISLYRSLGFRETSPPAVLPRYTRPSIALELATSEPDASPVL